MYCIPGGPIDAPAWGARLPGDGVIV
jgi:hypothetical protein